jgi:hypothetical protein
MTTGWTAALCDTLTDTQLTIVTSTTVEVDRRDRRAHEMLHVPAADPAAQPLQRAAPT